MNTFTEMLARLWPLWLLIAHLGGAVAVTIHALFRKREVAAVTGWIGLAWLAPVIGPILYLCLGVNRIQRKGISLGLREVWDHRKAPEKIQEDEMRIAELSRRYPTLVGLARLGEQVTGHPILPGNAVEPLVNGDEAYPQMLAAIDEATTSVNLLSYIFDSDRSGEQFLAALKRACARGVGVRVLIDSVGAATGSMAGLMGDAVRTGVNDDFLADVLETLTPDLIESTVDRIESRVKAAIPAVTRICIEAESFQKP